MSDPLPFERLPEESTPAWAAFVCYRDLGTARSVESAYEVATKRQLSGKRASGTWQRWCSEHNWVDRARSYDAALDARARAATENEAIDRRRRMIEGHAEQARELGTIARRLTTEFNRRFDEKGTLQWISGEDFIKMVAQLPKILDTAQKLERLAEGEATERHEHLMTREAAAALTDDEFDTLLKERGLV